MTHNIPYGEIANFLARGTTRPWYGEFDKDWWDEYIGLNGAPYNLAEISVYVGTGNFRRLVRVISFQNMFAAIEQKKNHKVRFRLRERV
ncbi:MAG: hypothetical protein PHD64_11205 [Mesotoga sp.]|jgi:hypothetical protein|nr:hypothetical protein [Mesotoga sp.]